MESNASLVLIAFKLFMCDIFIMKYMSKYLEYCFAVVIFFKCNVRI